MNKKPSDTLTNDEESILREAWGDALFSKVKERLNKNGHGSAPPEEDAGRGVAPELSKSGLKKEPKPPGPTDIKREDLIGQAAAKAALDQMISMARLNQERTARKLAPFQVTLHAVFAGSPGTGKTTFARFYAQEVKRLGLLKSGHLVEVSRTDLVAEFVGQTAAKTTAMVKKALGGILFIDEAYSLKNSKDDAYGQECIDTLVKQIEDHRNDLVVILAGYTEEMRNFLHTNTGLASRIPNFIMFEDYSDEELGLIFDSMLRKIGMTLSPQNRAFVIRQIAQKRKARSFGNAREVRNIMERSLSQAAMRLSGKDLKSLPDAELTTLIYSDFTESAVDHGDQPPDQAPASAVDKLNALTGLSKVKSEIRRLADYLKLSQKRSGGKVPADLNMHMVFTGNPGTGKSTVARLLGEIYRELGMLGGGHVVEVDRAGLVAGFVGQTAIKTKEKISEALGGVLFIDEAYALKQDGFGGDNFGQESIDALLKSMEDHRGKFAVVFAGYPAPMDTFLESNPGLKSRVANIIEFEDFKIEELIKIAKDFATVAGFTLSTGGEEALKKRLEEGSKQTRTFGNAREARNLIEKAFKHQAERLLKERDIASLTQEELTVLEAADF